MMESQGALLGPKAVEQIAKMVREHARRMMNEQPQRARWQRGGGANFITGKLDADLDVATAFADDPSTAVLSVWRKDSNGDYVDSGDNITVTNRYLFRSYKSGTICVVAPMNGEHRIIDSDCEAV
jgi:hypothetical protein